MMMNYDIFFQKVVMTEAVCVDSMKPVDEVEEMEKMHIEPERPGTVTLFTGSGFHTQLRLTRSPKMKLSDNP